MLTVKNINEDHPDLKAVKNVYENAFPEEERIPFDKIYTGCNDALAFYEYKHLMGFVSLLYYQDIVNIVYFAVDQNHRNQGYGSKILQYLIKRYPNKRLYVDIEQEDEKADNALQRHKRKQFYLRNHFQMMDYMYTWNTVTYQILTYPSPISAAEILSFWKQFTKHVPVFGQ